MPHPIPHDALDDVFAVWRALQAVRLGMTADDDELKSCFGDLAGLLADTLGDAYFALLHAQRDASCSTAPEV